MTTAISTFVCPELYILGPNGDPIKVASQSEYNVWHKRLPKEMRTRKGMRLGRAEIPGIVVSTVFLGKAHGYQPETNHPILWESVVLKNEELYIVRYTCEEDAILGHESLCLEAFDDDDELTWEADDDELTWEADDNIDNTEFTFVEE